jgi:hypothetical protein
VKKNNKDTIGGIILKIKNELVDLKENPTEQSTEKIDTLLKNLQNLGPIILGLYRFLFILIIIVLCFGSYLFYDKVFDSKVARFNEDIRNMRNDSLVRAILEIKEFDPSDSSMNSYTYLIRNKKAVTYSMLMNERDSFEKLTIEKNKLIDSISSISSSQSQNLDLIMKNYPITFKHLNGYTYAESKQIDSALMILNHFRSKLHYDSTKKWWTIDR